MTRDPFTRPKWSYPSTQGTAVLVHHSESDYDTAWGEVADKVQAEYGDRLSHIVKLYSTGADGSDTVSYRYRVIFKIPSA